MCLRQEIVLADTSPLPQGQTYLLSLIYTQQTNNNTFLFCLNNSVDITVTERLYLDHRDRGTHHIYGLNEV